MFYRHAKSQNSSLLGVPATLRQFSRKAGDTNPMSGRFKPRNFLNFDKNGRYLLYRSEFSRAARAKKFAHPKNLTLAMTTMSIFGSVALLRFLYNYDFKKRGYIVTMLTLACSYWFLKTLRRSFNTMQIVNEISLKADGMTVELTCHAPFNFRTLSVPIKDMQVLREDDLARKLRREPSLIDMRCIPIIHKDINYNLFIEGTICDGDVFRAVTAGKEIDTSESVNPLTFHSLIVDV